MDKCKADFTYQKICTGKAGYWNFVCAPFVLVWRSLTIFCFPCLHVLFWRCLQPLQRRLPCWKYPYEDETFFGASALGDHDDESGLAMQENTDWLRAHELDGFAEKQPQLFEGKIEPSDLCQGAVGDCWLVAAFACAAEFEDCIRAQFVTKEYNVYGRYQVRIFNPIKKKIELVTVDDRIPCKKGSKKPRFMKPNGSELWAILLEKAYAKWCGSYAALSGGFVLWAWHVMTGDNVFILRRQEKDTWKRIDMVPEDDVKDRRACGWRSTAEVYTDDQIWTLLKKYDAQKALMSASIAKSSSGKFSGPCGEEMLEKEGLVAGHAYSVIQAREVTEGGLMGVINGTQGWRSAMDGGTRYRLLQVRNPWGSFEWKGAWSDKSEMWDKNPSIKQQLNHTADDDGAFWISFEDFIDIYTKIDVCDRTTVNDLSLTVNESEGMKGLCKGCFVGCCYYWLCCAGAANFYFGHESTKETVDMQESGTCTSCLGGSKKTDTTAPTPANTV